jgi:hypothetical protein
MEFNPTDLILRSRAKHGVSKDGHWHDLGLRPSFETRESKSAVADFDTIEMPKSGRPDFGARSSDAVNVSAASVILRCPRSSREPRRMPARA